MGFLAKLEGVYDSAVGATTDAFEFLGNKLKGENDAEKGTKSEDAAAGTNSAGSTSNSEKEATETTDSDKGSDQGKLSEDPNKLEFFRYPIEVQSLGDKIKHWIEIDISEIQSETLTKESAQSALTDAFETTANVLKGAAERATNAIESGMTNGDPAAAVGGTIQQGLVAAAELGTKLGGTVSESLKGMITTVRKESPRNKLVAKLAIYMPDTLFFNQRNNYIDRSFDYVFGKLGQAAQIGSAIGKDLSEGISSGTTSGMVNSLLRSPAGRELAGRTLGGVIGSQGDALEQGLLKGAGFAINPQVELFFTGVDRRTFQFDFRFNSRSAKETEQIQGIIKALRKHAAPTLPGQGSGRYWIPPSIFDITFCYSSPEKGWMVNDKLPKINRCVLETIDVNYNGSGKYITYEDGQPIDIEVRLQFRETDIMTRAEIEAGY